MLFIFFFIISITVLAKRSEKNSEFGVLAGTSYYTGELNPNGHFRAGYIHPLLGVSFRRNFNTRWGLRFSAFHGNVSGNDAIGYNFQQKSRRLSFRSPVTEISGQFEFNFFSFSAAEEKSQPYTPFLFFGVGVFRFNPKGNIDDSRVINLQAQHFEGKSYSRISISTPFGVGVKCKFNQRMMLSFEYGLRKTVTDYIDDVSTVYSETQLQRGNSQNKDWYVFTAVSLNFRLGKKYTSCEFGQDQSKRHHKRF